MGGGATRPDGSGSHTKHQEGAYWAHKEMKEFGGSNQKFFDHHTFYIARKAAKGVWGLPLEKNFHNRIPCNAGECPLET